MLLFVNVAKMKYSVKYRQPYKNMGELFHEETEKDPVDLDRQSVNLFKLHFQTAVEIILDIWRCTADIRRVQLNVQPLL